MPRCQQTFRAHIGIVGHLRIQCTSLATTITAPSTTAPASTSTPTTTTPTHATAIVDPRASLSSIDVTSINSTTITATTTTKATASTTLVIDRSLPDIPSTINIFTITTPFPAMWTRSQHVLIATAHSPHIYGFIGHLRIHRTYWRTSAWGTSALAASAFAV
ncbi:hypothetical protein SprV_0100305600 [Sparganum proliferum]